MRVGQRLGNFELVELLGQGGMGEVYGARHVHLGHEAAIKVLRQELCTRRDLVDRFYTEAKAVVELRHPGIIQVHDFDEADGAAFIVMERLVGESLRTRLQREGTLTLDRTIAIIDELAAVMELVHAKAIVHRDLKPDNIFLVKEASQPEHVKVLDFGIAKLMHITGPTQTGAVLGTPHYLSPEQCSNTKSIGPHADQYALGCVAFEMLTGHPPFFDAMLHQLIGAHLFSEPPSVASCGVTVPEHVEAAIRKALAKSASDRHASVAAFATALRGVVATQTLALPSVAVAPAARRRRSWSWIVGGAVAASAVATAVLVTRNSNEPTELELEDPRVAKMWEPTLDSCRDGVAAACTKLARAYNGLQLADDPKARLHYAELACKGDDGEGCALRGLAYKRGQGTIPDEAVAVASFERACTLGVGNGCMLLGREYASGQAGTKDLVKSVEVLRRGCALSHAGSCGDLGATLLEMGGRPDEAEEKLRLGCDLGSADACSRLSKLFERRGATEDARAFGQRACSLDKQLCR